MEEKRSAIEMALAFMERWSVEEDAWEDMLKLMDQVAAEERATWETAS